MRAVEAGHLEGGVAAVLLFVPSRSGWREAQATTTLRRWIDGCGVLFSAKPEGVCLVLSMSQDVGVLGWAT
jgi:hypothetical protein